MLQGLWKELGEGFGKRWLLTVFGPALLFWGASLLVYTDMVEWGVALTWWEARATSAQTALIAGALALVVFTAILLEQFTTTIALLFEGYWPWPLRRLALWLSRRRGKDLSRKQQRFSQLKLKELQGQATDEERAEALKLDAELGHRPPDPALAMPTALGDVLRAAEDYPRRRYGLDPVVTWPRLYPSLGETLRGALAEARSNMDALLRVTTLSLIFTLVWGIWLSTARYTLLLPWVVMGGLIIALLSYIGATQAAVTYGDLLRSAFDLHRFDLYKALHWPLPSSWEAERPAPTGQAPTHGQALSEFLYRGLGVQDVVYNHPKDAKG
ncbi:MAG: hypothetical protein ACE5NP_13920 [Anaerolineae bacterium]